jgi:uncharacterized protein with NAD-binding domain and iron-sulfur cluster
MPRNVFVIGGGVAGLTAAHELSERGYTVTIYEARTERGGKVRSWLVPLTTQPTKKVPAEHGFRFFPGFYRHVTHTMDRIANGSSSVYQSLVGQPQTVMAPQRNSVAPDDPLLLSLPPGPAPVAPPNAAATLNLTATDYVRMAAALTFYQVLIANDETVADQGPLAGISAPRKLDDRSWWNYCGAGAGSNNYRLFFGKGLTRCFVATRAEEMSARTGAGILLQLLFDIAKPDRFEIPPNVRPSDRALNAPTSTAWIKPWTTQLQNPQPPTVPGAPTPTKVTIKTGTVDAVVTTTSGTGRRVTSLKVTTTQGQKTIAVGSSDSVVFAVSLDGARALIASDAGLQAEPELARVANPAVVKNRNMNGIQFYLVPGSLSGPLIRGHYLLVESSWAITALSQDSRWWKAGAAPTGGILSVIISDWLTAAPGPGGKSALASNDADLTTELWRQLRQAIPELPVAKPPYAIDVGMAWDAGLGSRVNTEPMLVNTTDSWASRPHAGLTGSVANLVIAGDFVRGITDFASMELANETARRAVNVLLQRDGLTQTYPRCLVYDRLEHLSVGALLTAAIKQLSKTAAFAVAKLLGLKPSDTDPNQSWWPYEFRSGAKIDDTADIIFTITDWMDRVLKVDTSQVTQRLAAKSGAAPDGPTAEALRFIAFMQDVHRETFTTMETVYGPVPRKG